MEQTRLYELIRRYADEKATPEEVQELHAWYRTVQTAGEVEWPVEDPSEEEQLRQRIWRDLGINGIGVRKGRVRRMTQVGWSAAACLILLAGVWLAWQYLGNKGSDQIAVYNPWGKILQVSLPDSSHVWLNAASTLRYKRSFGDHRELYLDGEGYFDVAEDPVHPFVVHAGQLTTTVLGTSFDVRSFGTDSAATVTVIRGKVQVNNEGNVLDRLTPARQLRWDDRTGQSRTVSVDTASVLAWQQGQFRFDNEKMETIAGILSRWYNVKILFKDSALRDCRLLGTFRNNVPLSQILTILSNVIDMQWSIDEKNRIVLLSGKGCR